MERIFNLVPKHYLAIAVISFVLILVIAQDPPRSECDSQFEAFKSAQAGFVYSRSFTEFGRKKRRAAEFRSKFESCQLGNSPGACGELFSGLRAFADGMSAIPRQCGEFVQNQEQVPSILFEGLRLFTQLAWGETPPKNIGSRAGWLDASDLATFCRLRTQAEELFPEKFLEFRAGLLGTLPLASQIPEAQRLQLSLFGIACDKYR